jgi:hypothetical protein
MPRRRGLASAALRRSALCRRSGLALALLVACGDDDAGGPVDAAAPADAAALDAATADAGPCTAADMPQPNLGLSEAAGQGGCPSGMRRIDATVPFCVDMYEAALVLIGDGSPWSPYFNPGGAAVRAVSIAGAVPQGYINATQAQAACAASGKRLCSDAEWLRACQGAAGSIYPYGDTRQPGVCNDARAMHPAIEYFGSSDPSVFSMLDHSCLNQLEDGLDPAGANPGCVTAEGLLDMMGNLHEWTADPAGTFRGGFYVDTMINGNGCLYRTTAHDVSHWDYSTGFRCCADAS